MLCGFDQSLGRYIISSLPSVGPGLAKNLLKKFKTVKNVINANENQLKKIDGVGEKTVKKLKEITDDEYKE